MNVTIETAHAVVRAEPGHGRPVTFEVRLRNVDVSPDRYRANYRDRYVVGLKGSNGSGFAHFASFEKAVRSALSRARRYEKAYDRPRGVNAPAHRGAAA